jgi:hypothetical protein
MTISEIRDLIITGSYMIGDGMREPLNWKDYANKLEETLVKNNGVLPCVSKSLPICNVESCEKWQSLAKHKVNLIAENEQLRQRLIDAGLEKPAIRIDYSRHS